MLRENELEGTCRRPLRGQGKSPDKSHGDVDWSGGSGGGEKCWDPGYAWKVGPTGFAEGPDRGM